MTAHRVSLLRSSLRRFPDPTSSRDPQVRVLVDQLSRLPVAPGLDPAFRSELRAQLVAIAPRMVAEGAEQIAREAATAGVAVKDAATGEAADNASGAPRRAGRAARGDSGGIFRLGRGLRIATATLAVLALLLGGAVWLSRSALPGSTLYGLKRASESVQLATASSDTDRAGDYLQFAQTRAGEVKALLASSRSGAVDARTASLIEQTLTSSDSDVRSATSLLGRAALAQHSDSPLQTVTSWAPAQLARLTAIWTAMPLGPLRAHAASSKALVAAAASRAAALHNLVSCACMSGASTDQLGPVPCKVCSAAPAGTPGSQPGQHTGTRTGSVGKHTGSGTSGSAPPGNAHTGTAGTGGSLGGAPGGGSLGSSPKVPLPVSKVPQLPLPLPTPSSPTLPKASVGTCGISVSAIGVHVDLGTCPTTHK